ncbi:uncharacterized protein LOC134854361 isoform X2 [Symsagittifera roscoffensis]|uniref:uncharacterized protein LOC134854361 isoform X2 n=1 Tax=Symsagittifera roscoffensis TaxID=84072 RepID=UPI00307B9241
MPSGKQPSAQSAGANGVGSSDGSAAAATGNASSATLRVELDSDDNEMLQDTNLLIPSREPRSTVRRDSVGSETSATSAVDSAKRHWKKGAVGLLGTMVFLGTISTEVAETVQLNRLEDKSHQVGMMEEAFAQKERTLLTLNMREKNSRDKLLQFVSDTGLFSFATHGSSKRLYAPVQMVKEKSINEANEICSFVGAELAEPTSFQEYQAIAMASREKGKCFLGPTRNHDGVTWDTQEGNTIVLDPYWVKGQPSKSVAFSCVYISSTYNQTGLTATQCNGDDPGITCFVCQRPQKVSLKNPKIILSGA